MNTELIKINLDNRGIVIEDRKATVLPETCWILLRRICDSENKTATIDDLCDNSKGESVWKRDFVPDDRSLLNFAKRINDTMEKAGMTIRMEYQDGLFSLHQ